MPTQAAAHVASRALDASDAPPGRPFRRHPVLPDTIDTAKWHYRLPGPADTSLAADLEHIETVLAARASAMGVEIRRGLGVEAFDQSREGVSVHAGGETFRGRWLVGCDGGRSTVRKAGGFDFVGTDPEFTGYSVDVEMADPDRLSLGRHYTPNGMYTYARPGTIAMVAFDGGAFHRTQPITLEHVQAVLRRISGTDVTLTALRLATTWTDRAYQATAYREGAGAARRRRRAHPLSLGWPGTQPRAWRRHEPWLEAGRDHPGRRAGRSARQLFQRTASGRGAGSRLVARPGGLMRPTRSSRALEAILRDLIDTRDGATYFAGRVWGVSLRYDLGGRHPLIGRSAPDFAFPDGTKLGDLLGDGKGLLLDFRRSSHRFKRLRAAGGIGSRYVARDAKDRLGLSAVLVRPDGIVAWAGETAPDHEDAAPAVSRWFGEPEEVRYS